MAEAAITFLLENLKNLWVEQKNLSSGAQREREQLEGELELMNAFLSEYRDREKGPVLKQIERQIREAVYEAEDTLDSCLSQKANSFSLFSLDSNLNLAKKVKDLRLDLLPIFDRAIKGLNALPVPATTPPTSSSYRTLIKPRLMLREDNVVGFADEEATLIKYLCEKTEQLDVISIVGMPGLGKTTLAWKIYRDPKIQFEFPTLIWVNVSQDFNVREVLLTILKKFTREDMSSKEDYELAPLVRSHLQRMGRFLLFMDDVWTVEDWKQIEPALPRNNKSGKVLITSRHERVAKQTNLNREPHKLRFLNADESWELLQLEVFGNGNTCPGDLEGVGKHIAKHCWGVPLAVLVIGQTLAENCLDSREWEKALDCVRSYINNYDETLTEYIISLSYNGLPHYLRNCFLYLGMFPGDTEIPVWNLIRLWIAEGFIQNIRGRSLEEVAMDNLNNLVARNLVMVAKANSNGDVKTCRVHGIIRNFCQSRAAYENKNMFQEVKKTRKGVFEPDISEIEIHRRLCIHSNAIEFLCKKPKVSSVRSFLCFSKEMINLPSECTSSFPRAFNLLRVLDATPLKFAKSPPKLSKLIHLRYIALSVDQFKALPEAVSKLWNLQTLKIDSPCKLEIEMNISKMKKLRHLKTKAAICLQGEGGKDLQTLSRLSAKSCKEELFSTATNLKNLGIRGNLTNLVEASYLGKLERLEKLKLVHDMLPSTSDDGLHRVPHQSSFPPNLRVLTLSSTHLLWTQMSTLGSLHTLEVLKLKETAFKGALWEAQGGGFPNLETLHISRSDLQTWTASGDPFPKLKNLTLKNCEKLQEIPSAVANGKSLQLMEIERVSSSILKSAEKINKEKHEMQGWEGKITYISFVDCVCSFRCNFLLSL